MRIPQDIIDNILSLTDIVDLISEYVPLRKMGANFKACCPFHNENTPSFVVSPEKQIYHCFGCGKGGNSIKFLMDYSKLNFPEAMKALSEKTGVPLPEEQQQNPEKYDHIKQLKKVLAYAHWFFKDHLKNSPAAKKYLTSRGITNEIIEKFEIGFAPNSFELLTQFLTSKNIPLKLAEQAGLIKHSQKTNKPYDFFRNRIIFPIFSEKGDVIAFGGRTLSQDDKEAKYINSPETAIYHKSNSIYGLYQSKAEIIKHKKAIIVEGYIDTIACHQLAEPFAVAPLGTALTDQQVKRLKRLTQNIILMFDNDKAGKNAAYKAYSIIAKMGVHPRIALLPNAKDPGDLLEAKSQELLQEAINNAPLYMDWFMTEITSKTGSLASDKAKSLKILKQAISKLADEVDRMVYEQKSAESLNIYREKMNKNIEKHSHFVNTPLLDGNSLTLTEKTILGFLKNREGHNQFNLDDVQNLFENPIEKELLKFIFKEQKNNETFEISTSISRVPVELQSLASKVLTTEDRYKDINLNDCYKKLKRSQIKRKHKALTAQMKEAELKKDSQLKAELLHKIQLLKKEENNIR